MKKTLSLVLMLSMILMLFSCNEKQVVQNDVKDVKDDAVPNDVKTAEVVHTDYSDMYK